MRKLIDLIKFIIRLFKFDTIIYTKLSNLSEIIFEYILHIIACYL